MSATEGATIPPPRKGPKGFTADLGGTLNGFLLLFAGWFLLANAVSLRSELPPEPAAAEGRPAPGLAVAGTFAMPEGASPDGPLPPARPLPAAPAPPGPAPEVPARPAPAPARAGVPARLVNVMVQGNAAGYAVTLAFDQPVLYRSSFLPGPRILELSLFPAVRDDLASRVPPLSFLKSVADVGSDARAVLRFQLRGEFEPRDPLPAGEGREVALLFKPEARRTGLAPGARLDKRTDRRVAPGLVLSRHRYKPSSEDGSDVHVLAVDPTDAGCRLALGYPQGNLLQKEAVTGLARGVGALAAINASFFAGNGDPLGLLAEGGEILSMPLMARGVLGVFDGGRRVLVGNPGYSGRIDFQGGSLPIDGINQVRKAGSVIVYTPQWGEATRNPGGGLEMAVVDGKVVDISDGNAAIPPEGFVVAVQGGPAQARLATLGMGSRLAKVTGLTPPWDRADFAVGGGPVLVRDGELVVEWREEGFQRGLVVEKAPRTAVGIKPDGGVLLVAVDGRRPGESRGIDLYELAEILAELGCRDALNMDGGGSTTMVVEDRIVNRVSDARPRAVSSILAVVGRAVLAGSLDGFPGG